MTGALAVALHDIEPRSFARAQRIRTWLEDRGIERITLLVIPAADRHPIGDRGPALAAWLRGRVAQGDAIAQHGLTHKAIAPASWPRRWQGGAALEFPGLDRDNTAERVQLGRRLLADIELEPRGFVAPGYAYTRALRTTLSGTFDWFADLRAVHSPRGGIRSPALCLGTSTTIKRPLSPRLVRSGAVMRVDIHPADFDLPGHVRSLESLIDRATGREAVTYDQLVA